VRQRTGRRGDDFIVRAPTERYLRATCRSRDGTKKFIMIAMDKENYRIHRKEE